LKLVHLLILLTNYYISGIRLYFLRRTFRHSYPQSPGAVFYIPEDGSKTGFRKAILL